MAPVMQFSSVSQPGLQSLSSGSQYSQVVYSPPTWTPWFMLQARCTMYSPAPGCTPPLPGGTAWFRHSPPPAYSFHYRRRCNRPDTECVRRIILTSIDYYRTVGADAALSGTRAGSIILTLLSILKYYLFTVWFISRIDLTSQSSSEQHSEAHSQLPFSQTNPS